MTTTSHPKVPLFPTRAGDGSRGRTEKRREIEVAPGKEIVALPPSEVDRIAVCDLIPTGDASTYRAVARVHSATIRVSVETLKKLNLGIRQRTLVRLIQAGFVDGARIAPNCYTFKLQSYYDHYAAVRKAAEEGNDFWTGDNLARYRAAI